MAPAAPDNSAVRFITLNSILTCVYTPLLVLILFYFGNLYSIGKRTCLPFIGILVLAEFLKLCVPYRNLDSTSTQNKSNKIKKYYFRNKFKSIFVILTMVVLYYVIAVLFGAPFLSEQEETLMFSLLLTALTVVPSCLNLGADITVSLLTNLTTYQGEVLAEMIKHNICLTLFGAWLGAIVIPLDWDRPWQVWPIPCCLGAIVGYIFSHIVVLIKLVPKFAKFFVKKTGKYGL